MKKKRINYFKGFSLFLAIAVLLFIAGCSGVTPLDPIINSFSASPSTITGGESSILSRSVTDATSVSIDNGVGSVALTGTTAVNPTTTTTYTLTATNASGSVTATTTVNVAEFTVNFNSQGGSAVAPQMVEYGEKVTEPTAPTKEGYIFGGWYKESGCINVWDFATDTVIADVTLYAKWTALYALRDTGPAGGLIFYVKEGGYSDGWMYLEAAPASTEAAGLEWGSYGAMIWGTATAIGTGQDNTTKIVAWLNGHFEVNCAAQFCDNLVFYNCYGYICAFYDDWFLPSKDELNQMYLNLKAEGAGGFGDLYFWSSSEYNIHSAWGQFFFNGGNQYHDDKDFHLRVRAVRAF